MKKIMINILLVLAVAAGLTSCKQDWTIKDVPPIQEQPEGFGYVAGFNNGGSVMFAVEVPSDGSYTIAVTGRATTEGTPGTGRIWAGESSQPVTFDKVGNWSEQTVTLQLHAGVNDVVVDGEGGNGLFHLDYIELK